MSYSAIQGKKIIDEQLKQLGIFDYLYNDETVTEVMINSDKKMFITKQEKGNIYIGESNNDKVMIILNTLASLSEITLGLENPDIDGELPMTKMRVIGQIPPVVENPSLNIRKKIPVIKTLDDYVNDKFITKESKEYLEKAIEEGKNILVVGGTNSGKTTFLNALLGVLDRMDKRLVILEEVEELQTKCSNVHRVKIIRGVYSAERGLKAAMRQSPERLIFGEIRGNEAYDYIKGQNSGHEGGLSTIHANSGLLGLKKLEMYMRTAIGFSMSEEIGMTVNIVITLKIEHYKRVFDSIVEVEEYDTKEEKYRLKTIYKRGESLRNGKC